MNPLEEPVHEPADLCLVHPDAMLAAVENDLEFFQLAHVMVLWFERRPKLLAEIARAARVTRSLAELRGVQNDPMDEAGQEWFERALGLALGDHARHGHEPLLPGETAPQPPPSCAC